MGRASESGGSARQEQTTTDAEGRVLVVTDGSSWFNALEVRTRVRRANSDRDSIRPVEVVRLAELAEGHERPDHGEVGHVEGAG